MPARELVVSGVGVTSSVGQGREEFSKALLEGRHAFRIMERPGRQWPLTGGIDQSHEHASAFLGAEIDGLKIPEGISRSLLRTASFSAQVALATLHEAWHDADLSVADPTRIGLLVGGSNLQQREIMLAQGSGDTRRFQFLRPTYGMTFLDSDICGICSESLGISGFAYSLGGASASGQVAVIQAAEAVRSGQVDVCIALGALMDLSCWELQGLRGLGAMGSDRFAEDAAAACRPFDRAHDGFIYGENCAALVIEAADTAERRAASPYARLAGWGIHADGNRNPNPSLDGEINVTKRALAEAGWAGDQIDYVNPHGTGSPLGDETELKALRHCGLEEAYLNTTKSICGHGVSAAGAVELVATVLQMRAGRLHPSRNLDDPIDTAFQIVGGEAIDHSIHKALKLSFGFGGINTALCLEKA